MPEGIGETVGSPVASPFDERQRLRVCAQATAHATLAVLVLLLVAGFMLPEMRRMPPLLALFIGIVPVHIGGLATTLFVLAEHAGHNRLRTCLQLMPPRPGELPFMVRGVATALLWFYPLSILVTAVLAQLLKASGVPPSKPFLQDLLLQMQTPAFALAAVVCILVLAPVAEEILFRLVLHDALLLIGRQTALIGAALTFALLHGVPEQIPALFMLGLLLQTTRRRFQSLWPAIGLHAAYNAISLACLYLLLALGAL